MKNILLCINPVQTLNRWYRWCCENNCVFKRKIWMILRFVYLETIRYGLSVNIVLGLKTIFFSYTNLNSNQYYPIWKELLQTFASQFPGKTADFVDNIAPQFDSRNFPCLDWEYHSWNWSIMLLIAVYPMISQDKRGKSFRRGLEFFELQNI